VKSNKTTSKAVASESARARARRLKLDRRHEILIKEWDICEAGIARFNGLIFRIRSWAITAFSGILVLAVTQREPRLLYAGIVVTLVFWAKEGSTKIYEKVFIRRVFEIQRCLRSEEGTGHLRTPEIANDFAKLSVAHAVSTLPESTRIVFGFRVIGKWASMLLKTIWATMVAMVTAHSFFLYCALIGLGLALPNGVPLFGKPFPLPAVERPVLPTSKPVAAVRLSAEAMAGQIPAAPARATAGGDQ
jgi:hypothetical protein